LTEVPEYLLERSRERRRALGLSGGEGGEGEAAAPAASTGDDAGDAGAVAVAPAASTAAPAEVVETAPEPRAPDPPWVLAARSRHKIPMWVLPVLFLLPIWGYVYVAFLGTEAQAEGALVDGAELYITQGCSGCHGAGGGGGVGYAFTDGELLLTFPEIGPMLDWVARASEGYGPGAVIGDPNRPGGPHAVGDLGEGAVMPAFAEALTPAQLYAVVRHEREALGGEELSPEDVLARDETYEALEIAYGEETVAAALEAADLPLDAEGINALIEAAVAGEEGGGGGEGAE
jgi:mono/diheme cytochrome c family protein